MTLGGGLVVVHRGRASQRLRTGIAGLEEPTLHLSTRDDPWLGRADLHHDLAPVCQPRSDHACEVTGPEQLTRHPASQMQVAPCGQARPADHRHLEWHLLILTEQRYWRPEPAQQSNTDQQMSFRNR